MQKGVWTGGSQGNKAKKPENCTEKAADKSKTKGVLTEVLGKLATREAGGCQKARH